MYLGMYMYGNGSTSFLGFGNGGVPAIDNYSNNLDIYAHYSGFNGTLGSNFVTLLRLSSLMNITSFPIKFTFYFTNHYLNFIIIHYNYVNNVNM